jgi:hypothetical protein
MFDEENKPITLKIDRECFKYPCCPKCEKTLHIITSNCSKCSEPPYYRFFCNQCSFHGWVMLELSDARKEMMKEGKYYKFKQENVILNDAWICNLRKSHDE